eukprot:Plantae.Rhodophyta-Purpureofilum_apyrenoidigerum.ctg916.p1 GENE.Plantae.Rhodophyta-Purpureofilum_apyrenoidigerum.ctg916~~Plantae.Rhodophyta-Purpureofilum_apyrenoidigerum.ctg916.p1  ORF type:complete len:477 (-),score=99.72 Plantae.Rhodophyta-Purpureofilum_apyrenoidigerum.ctg916:183-1613(-)
MGGIVSTVGPNKAMVISGGIGKDARILVGGRAVIFPLFMRCDKLSLELRTIGVESTNSMTSKGVAINVQGVCQVKVSGYTEVNGELQRDINAIRLAAQHFLGAEDAEIDEAIRQTMEGHQRAILGTLTVEEVYRDRQAFSETVKQVATADMRNMGLEIVSYTISSITDLEGYLDALGIHQTEAVKREAEISRARNKAEAATMAAQHDLEAAIKINEALRRKAESNREVEMAQARIREEVGKAEERAIQAREIEKAVLQQDLVTMTVRQKFKEAEEQVRITEVLAQQEKIRVQARTLAEGEAIVIKKTKEGESIRQMANAEADRIAAIGQAEASALRKKNEVELELLKGKAEAYRAFGNAAIAVQAIEALPKIASSIATPLSQTEKMIFIGGGGGSEGSGGPSNFVGDLSKSIGTVTETVNAMTGVNINRILQSYASQMAPADNGLKPSNLTPSIQVNPAISPAVPANVHVEVEPKQ